MSRTTATKKELLITTVVWLFLMTGAGAFLGLKIISNTKEPEARQETETAVMAEAIEESEEEIAESEDKPAEQVEEEPIVEKTTPTASPFAGASQNPNGTNSSSTYNAYGHLMGDGLKYIYYKTMVWGTVAADFIDFRNKVAETLADARGWMRMGLRFVEVTEGQDLNIVLSDAANLEGYNGYCSGSLSCTSGYNEVIINDERWREGTAETAGGLSTRDYQHMVVNHEMGHWLGQYSHIEYCDVDGGVAPIMLQQSTGLRNCGAFNPWPLDSELWTER